MNGFTSLQVEKVAGGQLPPDEDIRLRMELAASGDPWCERKLLQLLATK